MRPALSVKLRPWWKTRSLFLFAISIPGSQLVLHSYFPLRGMLWELEPFHGEEVLGPFWGGYLGFAFGAFFLYWWHRLRHRDGFLWRSIHSMHHSPAEMNFWTSVYMNPLDQMTGLFCFVFGDALLRLSLEQMTWSILIYVLSGFLSHANVSTFGWMDLFLATPELHRVHHSSDVRQMSKNFSFFPLWDRLFGTYESVGIPCTSFGFSEQEELGYFRAVFGRELRSEQRS